jgi:hypothetical protein
MTITSKGPEELSGSETFPQQPSIITAFLNERLSFCETVLDGLIRTKLSMSERYLMERSASEGNYNQFIPEKYEEMGYKIRETLETIGMLKTAKAAVEINNGPFKLVMEVRIGIFHEISNYIDTCMRQNLTAKDAYLKASFEIEGALQKNIQRIDEDNMFMLNVRHAFINQFIKA